MAYVRRRGNQVLIVHGERDREAGKVEQRLLFTIYSRAEAARLLVGRGTRRPTTSLEAQDHNTGVDLRGQLHAYLHARARRSQRFFSRALALPGVAALLAEVEDLARRWFGQPKADRAIFERLNRMKTLDFAHARTAEVGAALGLPEEPPAASEPRRRRGAAVARVH